jgi:GMP synthase-like glutamine amidotransferase
VTTRLLIVENDPADDAGRLGAWLEAAGLEPAVVRPYQGDPLPAEQAGLDGVDGLLVLGGHRSACGPDPGWFADLRVLLARAVADRLPTLAVCLGAQLLAQATGGAVARAGNGPEIGVGLVAKRDAAAIDELFAAVPFTPDVVQWHSDEVSVLPPAATLLAAGTRSANQAFRVGERAWGVQFHPEADRAMVAGWVAGDLAGPNLLAGLGIDSDTLLDGVAAAEPDLEEVWRPVAERFATLVAGQAEDGSGAGGRPLPLVQP